MCIRDSASSARLGQRQAQQRRRPARLAQPLAEAVEQRRQHGPLLGRLRRVVGARRPLTSARSAVCGRRDLLDGLVVGVERAAQRQRLAVVRTDRQLAEHVVRLKHLGPVLVTCARQLVNASAFRRTKSYKTRMWANAQRDGRPRNIGGALC